MAKAEWGLKRICPSCGARYYDMKKNPPVCPNCGTAYDPEVTQRSRRGRSAPKAAPVEAPVAVVEEVEIPVAGEDGEEAVIEDAEELGENDAVEEVIVTEEER